MGNIALIVCEIKYQSIKKVKRGISDNHFASGVNQFGDYFEVRVTVKFIIFETYLTLILLNLNVN